MIIKDFALEFSCFRHPCRAEDAHGAFHWWCLWQCAAFRLPANRWCRRQFRCATVDFKVQMREPCEVSSDIAVSTSLYIVLVHLLGLQCRRHGIEGVCLPPPFSTRTVQRRPVGLEPSFATIDQTKSTGRFLQNRSSRHS